VGTTYPSGALEIAPLFSGVLVYHFDQLHILIFLVTCCDVLYDFRVSNVHDIRLTPICFIGIRVLYIMLFVFPVRNSCVYPRCLIKFILLCLLSCGVISIIVFVFLFFFFWPLCVSSELQNLITHLHLHNVIAKWTPPNKNGKNK
jgi:hypothetical protein